MKEKERSVARKLIVSGHTRQEVHSKFWARGLGTGRDSLGAREQVCQSEQGTLRCGNK